MKKVLFASHDVGPARYLEAITDALSEDFIVVASHKSRDVLSKYTQTRLEDVDPSDIKLVITGSSISDGKECLDKLVVKWAQANLIPSISVIDHWTWYRERFFCGSESYVPDYIFVNDDIAREQASSAGLPAQKLFIAGNPRLERMAVAHKNSIECKTSIMKIASPPKGGRLVVFVSEDLLSINKERGLKVMDEWTAITMIRKSLDGNDRLLIKLHPDEPIEKFDSIVNSNVSVISKADPLEIAVAADVVIGINSMMLLEIAAYRQDVMSLNTIEECTFIGTELGITTPIDSEEALRKALQKPYNAKRSMDDYFSGSASRCIKFIESVCQAE